MLSFPHQLLFRKVVLKISGTNNYFRLKNGWEYQNGLCVLVLISEQFVQSVKLLWLTISKWGCKISKVGGGYNSTVPPHRGKPCALMLVLAVFDMVGSSLLLRIAAICIILLHMG